MQPIPQDVLAQFDALLKLRNVPVASHTYYRKWLRYFLDFRAKYPLPDSKAEQVRLFVEKLRSKNQAAKQLEQAARAVSLYFETQSRKRTESMKRPMDELVMSPIALSVSPLKEEKVGSPPLVSEVKEKPVGGSPASISSPSGAPRVKGGKRFDEWRCLRKTESPAWDTIIEDLAAEIKMRHY
jgi:hypothetical protein